MHIALYKPDIPQNTAAIIRLSSCFDLKLHIIEPCGFNLNDASKRHYSNGKQNFTMHIEKKNFNLKKVRYWRYGNKNIYLIPLQDGRTLTLYGNLDQKSAQQIINNIKSNQG